MNVTNTINLHFVTIFICLLAIPYSRIKTEENDAPSCTITSPNNYDEIEYGSVILISVNAYDSDGNIIEVRFYIDGVEVGSSSNFPYNFEWNTAIEEKNLYYLLKATTKDNIGKSSTDEIAVSVIEKNNPIAEFSCDPLEVNQGQSVQFTDLSTNNPTSWSWDFGNGGTSTKQNPIYSYISSGIYTITLIVTNEFGSDTETKSNFIIVNNHETSTVTDIDGNTYNTIKIGTQWWMAENLKTTHYTDGTSIQLVESNTDWINLSLEDKAYCYYDNSTSYGNKFGTLYTWAAAMNGQDSSNNNNLSYVQGVCPSGWHLPSDNEWKDLEIYLGMSQVNADETGYRGTDEGYKLKSISDWYGDGNGSNSSGFIALPAGNRDDSGAFSNLNIGTIYWTAKESSSSSAWRRRLHYNTSKVSRYDNDKTYGLSVRCLKD